MVTPLARRAVEHKLPDAVAAAVIDFLTTALIGNPRRVGKPTAGRPDRNLVSSPATYRALYRINEHEVVILGGGASPSALAGFRG